VLVLSLVNPLVVTDTAVTSSVYGLVFQSCSEDYYFSMPHSIWDSFNAQGSEEALMKSNVDIRERFMCRFKRINEPSVDVVDDGFTMGEQIGDLRTLLHRYMIQLFTPSATTTFTRDYTDFTGLTDRFTSQLLRTFHFSRGSWRIYVWRSPGASSGGVVYLFGTVQPGWYGQQITSLGADYATATTIPTIGGYGFQFATNVTGVPAINMEVPYYTPYLMRQNRGEYSWEKNARPLARIYTGGELATSLFASAFGDDLSMAWIRCPPAYSVTWSAGVEVENKLPKENLGKQEEDNRNSSANSWFKIRN
jgi:hypothetical protein